VGNNSQMQLLAVSKLRGVVLRYKTLLSVAVYHRFNCRSRPQIGLQFRAYN